MKNFPPIPFFISSIALIAVCMLTPLNLTCPICDGTGSLKAAQDLIVKDTSVQLISQAPVYTFGECGTQVMRSKFTYSVNMTVTNNGSVASKGTVTVSFSRHPVGYEVFVQDAEGNMVVQEYMPPTVPAFVDVAAGATKTIHLDLTYIDDMLAPGDPPPQASITAGADLIDPTCGGTGRLTFVNWIGAKLKPPSFQ